MRKSRRERKCLDEGQGDLSVRHGRRWDTPPVPEFSALFRLFSSVGLPPVSSLYPFSGPTSASTSLLATHRGADEDDLDGSKGRRCGEAVDSLCPGDDGEHDAEEQGEGYNGGHAAERVSNVV